MSTTTVDEPDHLEQVLRTIPFFASLEDLAAYKAALSTEVAASA